MPNTAKFLDYDGLVQYTGKVKKAINDGDAAVLSTIRAEEVTDIQGTTTAPTYANDLNATATQRSAGFTNGGSSDTFPYYDTTYGDASTTKDGLMTHEDKVKLNGIAAGAEVNVQSDWAQTTTTADDYIKNKPTFASINGNAVTDGTDWLLVETSTLAGTTGAGMVGYDKSATINTVDAALDDIYSQIGGSGGGSDSLTSRVTALEGAVDDLEDDKADITAAVGSITGDSNGNESGSYTMVDGTTTGTFLYKNNKVAQEADTTTDGLIPILLGSGVTPNSVGGKAKYNTLIGYNPSSGVFNITNKTAPSSFIQINGDSISMYKQAGTGSVSISVDGGFSGTSARAISDGNGNNIVNTYATKAALDSISSKWTGQFHIADTLPTLSNTGDADVDAGANLQYLGYIYLIKDEEHGGVNDNVFNEHIVVSEFDESLDKMVWKWELLGTTDAGVDVVSLTTAEINTIWSTTAAAS